MKKVAMALLLLMVIGLLSSCNTHRNQRCAQPYSDVVHEDVKRI